MKNAIRILSLFLCLITALGCFTACQKDDTEKESDTAPTEEATEAVVIELGAVIDKTYTIVEIDRQSGTCLALLLEDEDSYKDGTYTKGREYDIETQEVLREIKYTRDSKDRLTKVVYSDPKTQDTLGTEEYAYTVDGRPLSSVSRDEKGLTIDSTSYTYNSDGSYTVATVKDSRLASTSDYDRTGNITARTDYEYKNDGTYTIRSYENGKLTQYIDFTEDGSEATRAVYTYNPDGSFAVSLYENGILKNEQTGTADEVVTQPAETTTKEEKETLAANAPVTVPTTQNSVNEITTDNNNSADTTSTRPQTTTSPTTTEPITDASGSIDMLAQSRIFRSGEYYLSGMQDAGEQMGNMIIAVTPTSTYASFEIDFAAMMEMGSSGKTEMGVLQTADGTYYLLLSDEKKYCPLDESTMAMFGTTNGSEPMTPEEMFGDISFSNLFLQISQNAQPDKTESVIINNEMVTCYTFNTPSGEYAKHYVDDNGKLLRVEDYSTTGKIANNFEVTNISGDVADYMKKIPSDYVKTDIISLFSSLLGDSGTVIE